jgi:transposase
VPADHPLRAIRRFVDPILAEMSPRFDAMYSKTGRPSIPPEQLLKALLLQVLYSVRSERMLCEQLNYNLLFRRFVGLGMDDLVWVPTVFTKNRDRLMKGGVGDAFFSAVVEEARRRGWLSDEHFTVDGTLLEASASHKSFRPKDEMPPKDGTRNRDVDFRGERRSNETHRSPTDPDARMARKGPGKEAKLCYHGNVLMDNRHGLIVDTEVRHATGTAETEAALAMLERLPPGKGRRTLGADKGYDTQAFVAGVREQAMTPHVAQNTTKRRSAIDGRTTQHEGYRVSQRKRKLVEQGFGWQKSYGLLGKLRRRGKDLVGWIFRFTSAAFKRLIRYCARGPFALDRLHLVAGRSDQILYLLPASGPSGRTALRLSALEFLDRLATILPPPRIHRHRYHGVFAPNAPLRPLVTARAHQDNALAVQDPGPRLPLRSPASPPESQAPEAPAPQPPDTTSARTSRWAALLARIYEVFPLICPTCQEPLTFIAFLTDPEPITQILAHIGEPTSPPLTHPPRGPPQVEFDMGAPGGETEEAAQESFPDDLDQSPEFDPTEPEPVPQDDFDRSGGA